MAFTNFHTISALDIFLTFFQCDQIWVLFTPASSHTDHNNQAIGSETFLYLLVITVLAVLVVDHLEVGVQLLAYRRLPN